MILIPDNEYVVVLDACVLAPMPVCDTLLRLASEPALYQVRWSEESLNELDRFLEKRNYNKHQRDRRINTMRTHFPEALVLGAENISLAWELPDKKDQHVIAASLIAHANCIVTYNEKHFISEELEKIGILVQHPDDFLLQQFTLNPWRVRETIIQQAAQSTQPESNLLERLERQHPSFVAALRSGQP